MSAEPPHDQGPELRKRRLGQLSLIIYLQALFLALTYMVGVYQTITSQAASFTALVVIEHGSGAAGFVLLTGVVMVMAGIHGLRGVAFANGVLFLVAVVGGATGFSFLGNPTQLAQMNMTNLSMIAVVGAGMPISGFSIATVSGWLRGFEAHADAAVRRLTYLALGAIALTVTTGTAVVSVPLNGAMLSTHFAFTGLMVVLLLAVLFSAVRRGMAQRTDAPNPRRLDYTLIALGGGSLAIANGAFEYFGGGVPYALAMAEFAMVAYGSLILVSGAPPAIVAPGFFESKLSTRPGRRVFLQLAATASVALAAVGLSALLRSITLAPPPTNVPPRTFPRYNIANLSDVQVDNPIAFNYPLQNEPNILVKLGTPALGGVGPDGDIVAFSQYCQHLGCVYAFQAPGTSPQCNSGYTAEKALGYCCCHGSIFDLANGAKVLGGPSPRPVPQVILEVDSSGNIFATGMTPPAIFGHSTGSTDVSNDLQGGELVA